ncbi:hypothetical protein SUDANB58_04850 [Streptomyces sp. enrichment culture]|uniref:NUDIX domain-containing protein n=1 Tax=Streptomyces sp. enrichment culture TaxID=1795815 RepID=UPI003F57BD3D
MPLSHDHIRTTVETYLARHPDEREQLGGLLDALDRPTDIASRSTFTGHVTCGAIVVNPLGRVLHVLHLAGGKVLAPGGHTEPEDESLAGAALRELHEETGIPLQAVAPWPGYEAVPFDIDAHPGKGEPGHQHFDLRFLFRLRIAPTTSDLVRRHAASLPASASSAASRSGLPSHEEHRPAAPHGTVLNVIGVHLYLERSDGTVLLGLRHPDSAFAPSTWHVLAGHCEQESAITCLIGEAREEAGLHIERQDIELVHVVHHIDKAGNPPRMGLFLRVRTWTGEPELREPDKCTQWTFRDPAALPDNLVPYTRQAIEKIRSGNPYSETGWPA